VVFWRSAGFDRKHDDQAEGREMRRLFVLMPTEERCLALVRALEVNGIPQRHQHVVAGLAHALRGLPKASVWQRTELAHGIEWGLLLGGGAGLLGGLLAVSFPPVGLTLGGGVLIAWTVAGGGLGALVTALLGCQEHNHRLDAFQRAIAAGQVLLVVDVPRNRVHAVEAMILQHSAEAGGGAQVASP
jgi:hypothetical protein